MTAHIYKTRVSCSSWSCVCVAFHLRIRDLGLCRHTGKRISIFHRTLYHFHPCIVLLLCILGAFRRILIEHAEVVGRILHLSCVQVAKYFNMLLNQQHKKITANNHVRQIHGRYSHCNVTLAIWEKFSIVFTVAFCANYPNPLAIHNN